MSQKEVTTKNKQTLILEAIRAGGATAEKLMEAANVNKAGLASQLAYLNSRGVAMAEVDRTKAEFPIKGEDGVFKMGTIEEYEAKARAFGAAPAKPKTRKEVEEAAQKREDKASAAYAKAKQKADDNPSDDIFEKAAELKRVEMELASMKLSRVQAGDFSYENVTIAEGENAPASEGPTDEPKKGKKPGSDNALV